MLLGQEGSNYMKARSMIMSSMSIYKTACHLLNSHIMSQVRYIIVVDMLHLTSDQRIPMQQHKDSCRLTKSP